MTRLGLAAAALGTCLAACSGPPRFVAETDEPAFANRRPSYDGAGRTLAYVANRLSDTVSVVDLDTMTVLGSPPVGQDPVDIDGPIGLAIDRARALVYVALSYPATAGTGPHTMHYGTPPRAGYVRALALDDLRPLGELAVERSPTDLALTDDGGDIVVLHADPWFTVPISAPVEDRRAALFVVTPASDIVAGAASPTRVSVCVAPSSIVYDRSRARAFVACAGEDALAVVDTQAATVLARVPAGDGSGVGKPYALVADPPRKHLLLSNRVLRQVVLFTADDAPVRVFASEAMAGVPYFAAWLSDADIAVPTQSPSGVVVIDAGTGAVRREIAYPDDVCARPRQIWRSRDGRVFVVCEGDHVGPGAVARLDPASLAVEARVTVGIAPDRLVVIEP